MSADVLRSSIEKGKLTQPGDTLPSRPGYPDDRLLPIAEGAIVPNLSGVKACNLQTLPERKATLAGYRPALDYFDPELPGASSNVTADGIDNDMQLKRSRLPCDLLASAQTWDATHNDLQHTWRKDANGKFVATRVTGRRAIMNANANRICAWTTLTDRDGVERVFGLNYQGRALVDAVADTENGARIWKVSESLYNADGNIVSRRERVPSGQNWTPTAGDTIYAYMDVYKRGSDNIEPMPYYWARRGNLISTVTRPRGGVVTEFVEGRRSIRGINTQGRYTEIAYEPLFNQVREVRHGYVDETGQRRLLSTTATTFDYQEAGVAQLLPLFERQRELGYRYPVKQDGQIDLTLTRRLIPATFALGDVDGDGATAATVAGLPVRVSVMPAAGGREVTTFRWNPSGQLYFVQSPDGASRHFRYLEKGDLSGSGDPFGSGFLAGEEFHLLTSYPVAEGPARAPCALLPGPYQWLLPDTCSLRSLRTDLRSKLLLPDEALDSILAGGLDGSTSYSYYPTGAVKQLIEPTGSSADFERDTDGRELKRSVHDGADLVTTHETSYDTWRRPTRRQVFDDRNRVLASDVTEYDEEGNIVFECTELTVDGCRRSAFGDLPRGGASRTFWYTPEGLLRQTQDAEGAIRELFRDSDGNVVSDVLTGSPSDEVRVATNSFDIHGQLFSQKLGSPTDDLLLEEFQYDGFGRLIHVVDREKRRISHSLSPEDALLATTIRGAASPTPLWTERTTHDAFGRAIGTFVNSQLVWEASRRSGGAIFREREIGRRPHFMTYDHEGKLAWSEDADGEIIQVATSRPSSTLSTSATVRTGHGQVRTTSMSTRTNGLGFVLKTVFAGATEAGSQLSRAWTYTPDSLGRPLSIVGPDGSEATYAYDLGGRVAEQGRLSDGGNYHIATYDYDRRGNALKLTDPAGSETTYSYNGFGELEEVEQPGARPVVTTLTYDPLGRIATREDGVHELRFQYDDTNRLEAVFGRDDLLRDYTYDDLGRLTEANSYNRHLGFPATPVPLPERTVTTTIGYDRLGRISDEGHRIGSRAPVSVKSAWSQRRTTHEPFTRWVTLQGADLKVENYDDLGRLSSIERGGPGALATTYTYFGDLPVSVASQTLGDSLTTSTSYDAWGQPLQMTAGTSASGHAYRIDLLRDVMGRIASYSRSADPGSFAEWRGFSYDLTGRLRLARESSTIPSTTGLQTDTLTAGELDDLAALVRANRWEYVRDKAVGSLYSVQSLTSGASRFELPTPRGPGSQLIEYDDGSGPSIVSHDSAGRIVTDGELEYSWDPFSSLGVVNFDGAMAEANQYDAFGRLVARWDDHGLRNEFAYDGDQMVASLDASGRAVWRAIWGAHVDELIEISGPAGNLLALSDGKGSIGAYFHLGTNTLSGIASFNSEGKQSWSHYDPTGNLVRSCISSCSPPLEVPFGLHLGFYSPASGLVYFRNRWYSPRAAQFLSRDPRHYEDSYDSYAFAKHDPINYSDPYGLSTSGFVAEKKGQKVDFGPELVIVPKPNVPKESEVPDDTGTGDDGAGTDDPPDPDDDDVRSDPGWQQMRDDRSARPHSAPAAATPPALTPTQGSGPPSSDARSESRPSQGRRPGAPPRILRNPAPSVPWNLKVPAIRSGPAFIGKPGSRPPARILDRQYVELRWRRAPHSKLTHRPGPQTYRYYFERWRPDLPQQWHVHHSIPQEYHHLFPGTNLHLPIVLRGVSPEVHRQIHRVWETEFKAMNPTPTRESVLRFSREMDFRFNMQMMFPERDPDFLKF